MLPRAMVCFLVMAGASLCAAESTPPATEVASNDTPVGVMINSPALIAAPFKKGRVVFCSPHPEQTKGLEDLIPHAVAWCATPGDSEKPAGQPKEATAGQ